MENNFSMNSNDIKHAEYIPDIIGEESFSKKESVLAFISVIVGYAAVKLFAAPLMTGFRIGLGAAVFLLILTVFCGIYSAQCNKLSSKKAFRIALCTVFSANVFISSDTVIQLLDAVFVFLVLAYDKLADSDERFSKIRMFFPADMMNAIFMLPFSEGDSAPKAIRQSAGKTNAGKAIKNTLLGLAIAIPSTAAVAVLLIMADDGFELMMDELLNDSFSKIFVFIVQLLFGLPAGFYFFGMCRAAKKQNSHELINDENTNRRLESIRFLPEIAGVSSAVPVCILYVMFFFSQLNYFIASFSSRLPDQMPSYAEYARRGFFELCIVSVINLCIITAVNLFCRNNSEGKKPVSVRVISCILSIFTILLITTAVSKMVMYINVYGLTLLRVFTTWFMVLLAIVFTGIFLVMTGCRINLSRMTVTAFIIMFIGLSLCNVDGLIAEYNVSRYLNGTLEEFDIGMTNELSTGAVPAMNKLSADDPELEELLRDKSFDAYYSAADDIRIMTLSDILAYNSMKDTEAE